MPRDRPSHKVELRNPSLLSALAGKESALVNSHHHQAIEKVGSDLMATAWTSDGLIEAIEDSRPERFALGVQWHPELGWKDDQLSQALFNRFITASRQYLRDSDASVPELQSASTT